MQPLHGLLVLLIGLILSGCTARADDGRGAAGDALPLVRRGEPAAVIVVADSRPPRAVEAAEVLQSVLREMSGAELPIRTESELAGGAAAVFVGDSSAVRRRGVAVEQDRLAGDTYVLRSVEGGLAVVGNDGGELRGSVYAAYDLLGRLGCGWFGPEPAWHVIPRADSITAPPLRVRERAAYDARDVWMVRDQVLSDAWRLGGRKVAFGHHNLDALVPRSLEAEHPDWFGPGQPDIAHPAVIRHIIERLRQQLDESQGFVELSLGANDNEKFADSAHARAIGNVSAQSLHLANEAARELRRTHPGRFALSILAYWVTHEPPDRPMRAEPEVRVVFVHEGNKAGPWDRREPAAMADFFKNNRREIEHFRGWKATGAEMAIYTWWIPGFEIAAWKSLPWYSGETALRDLRFWRREGVRLITFESDYETDPWPRRWPLYYVGARGAWDPGVKAERVMAEACAKLYGPAARPMQEFYALLERAVARTPLFHQNWNLPPAEEVYTPDVEARATALLEAAAAAAGGDPAIAARIEEESRAWSEARATLAALRRGEGRPERHKVYVDGKFMYWRTPTLSVDIVRSLIGLPDHIPVFAVMPDGSRQPTHNQDEFDVRSGVRFETAAPPEI